MNGGGGLDKDKRGATPSGKSVPQQHQHQHLSSISFTRSQPPSIFSSPHPARERLVLQWALNWPGLETCGASADVVFAGTPAAGALMFNIEPLRGGGELGFVAPGEGGDVDYEQCWGWSAEGGADGAGGGARALWADVVRDGTHISKGDSAAE